MRIFSMCLVAGLIFIVLGIGLAAIGDLEAAVCIFALVVGCGISALRSGQARGPLEMFKRRKWS